MLSTMRGFFKLHQVPTALAGCSALLLSELAGFAYFSTSTGYRRAYLALPPWHRDGLPSSDASFWPSSALSLGYAIATLSLAAFIFHVGVFPLYTHRSQFRYWHQMQDALATSGWSLMAIHNVATFAILTMLLKGVQYTARIAPLLVVLPGSHIALWLLPDLPPSMHCHLEMLATLLAHVPLAMLYMWRAYALKSPWELIGTAAEVLYLASLAPGGIMQSTSISERPTVSWELPWGSLAAEGALGTEDTAGTSAEAATSQEHTEEEGGTEPYEPGSASVDSIAARVARRHRDKGVAEAPAGEKAHTASKTLSGAYMPGVQISDLGTVETKQVHHMGEEVDGKATATPAPRRLFQGTVEEPGTEDVTELEEIEEHPSDQKGFIPLGKKRLAKALARLTPRQPPRYAWIILISMLAFFFAGGLIAITSAPPQWAMQAKVHRAVETVTNVAQEAIELPKAGIQAVADVGHAASDALHVGSMAAKAAWQVAREAQDLQHRVEKQAIHTVGREAVHAAEHAAHVTAHAAGRVVDHVLHPMGEHRID